jgi:hypothetical protein
MAHKKSTWKIFQHDSYVKNRYVFHHGEQRGDKDPFPALDYAVQPDHENETSCAMTPLV